MRFSVTALLVLPIAAAFTYALWLRLANWGPPERKTCIVHEHSVGLVRDFDTQDWGHHDIEPGQGTYLYVRIYGLLSTTTDSTSYLDLGLQLPANIEAGQTFTCTPAKRAREISEVDINGDSLSKLTEGEFAIFGYAYPRTGWLVSGSKVTARVAIERISRTRMHAQIQLAGQFDPDLGPLNIDRSLVFDRDLANSK